MFPTFEPTITLGAIIQTFILLAGIVSWGAKINHDISSIRGEVHDLQKASSGFSRSLEELYKVLTQVAVQDVRILHIEEDIDELRHNKGFIN